MAIVDVQFKYFRYQIVQIHYPFFIDVIMF
jgi:hypothetical protein